MGSQIYVDLKFEKFTITDDTSRVLDECMAQIGFFRSTWWHYGHPDEWAMCVDHEKTKKQEDDEIYLNEIEKDRLFYKKDWFSVVYGQYPRSLFRIFVTFYFSGTMKINRIKISNGNLSYRFEDGDEWEVDLASRFYHISKLMYEAFKPIEMVGNDYGDYEEPWFYFRKDGSKPLDELVVVDCYEQHMLYWLAMGDLIPCRYWDTKIPEEWEPRKPINYHFDVKGFFLVYSNEKGQNKEALFRNCLCCGNELPITENDNRYGKPGEDEIKKYREIAWKSRTLEEVTEKIGKPDIDLGDVIFEDDPVIKTGSSSDFEGTNNLRSICYTSLSKNAVNVFKEYKAGLIVVNYVGKEKLSIVK